MKKLIVAVFILWIIPQKINAQITQYSTPIYDTIPSTDTIGNENNCSLVLRADWYSKVSPGSLVDMSLNGVIVKKFWIFTLYIIVPKYYFYKSLCN